MDKTSHWSNLLHRIQEQLQTVIGELSSKKYNLPDYNILNDIQLKITSLMDAQFFSEFLI